MSERYPSAPKGIYPVDKVLVKMSGLGRKDVKRLRKVQRAVGNCLDPAKSLVIIHYTGPDGQAYTTVGSAHIVARLGRGKLRVAGKMLNKSGTLFEQRGTLMFEVD